MLVVVYLIRFNQVGGFDFIDVRPFSKKTLDMSETSSVQAMCFECSAANANLSKISNREFGFGGDIGNFDGRI